MEISTVKAFNPYSSQLDVCQYLVVPTPMDNMSKNMPSSFMSHVACEYKLWSVVRSSMHQGNWVTIKHAVVYYAQAAHAFSAGIKSRHCRCKDGSHAMKTKNSTKRTVCKMSLQD